ncbi:MAG: hypothetical protein AAFR77_17330 [Cyanobacteria bacterium J06631_2]
MNYKNVAFPPLSYRQRWINHFCQISQQFNDDTATELRSLYNSRITKKAIAS